MLDSFWSQARPTLLLALPIIAGQLSQMLMGVVDAAMVGHIGVVPLAASAFANNLLAIPLVAGIGLLSALSVRVSQAHGAGNDRTVGELLRQGLLLALAAGLLMTGATLLVAARLDAFGQPSEVAREARVFFVLLGCSLPPMFLTFALKNYCEAQEQAWLPMVVLLGAVPLNVAFNRVFIYGHLGSPAFGLAGAGLGTLLARLAALVALALFVWRTPHFAARLPDGFRVRPDWSEWRPLLQLGIPAALQTAIEVGAFAVGSLLVGRLGAKELAAHQIALTCVSTTFMLPLGIGIATSIRVAAAMGGGDGRSARSIGLNALALTTGITTLLALGYFACGHALAAAFVSDAAVVELAARVLFVVALLQLVDGLQVVGGSALRGLSDATVPLIAGLVAYWGIGLPAGTLAAFRFGGGVVGMWGGLSVGLTVAAALLVARFWHLASRAPTSASPVESTPRADATVKTKGV